MRRVAIIFLLVILIITGVLYLDYLLRPVAPDSDELVIVKIESGYSSRQIGQLLYEKELIHSPGLFSAAGDSGGPG